MSQIKMQAFEVMGKVAVGLYGTDDQDETTYERKLFHHAPKRHLTREEYLREMSISFQASAGRGEAIDWNADFDENGVELQEVVREAA